MEPGVGQIGLASWARTKHVPDGLCPVVAGRLNGAGAEPNTLQNILKYV